jgi:hypothetical protein
MAGEHPTTGTTPGDKGRFEGYDVVAQQEYWDPVTTDLVKGRLEGGRGELRYFTESEAETASALLDIILGQHDDPKVPVLQMVDARLAAGETDGWRYEEMPEDGDAWRQTLSGLDEDANEAFGRRFHECSTEQQGDLLQGMQDVKSWHGLPAEHVWSLWTRYGCAAFYSHPWAWNEIGFGGPAYPRGYKVLRVGWREPWERGERESEDPVPWMNKVESARRFHEVRTRSES